MKEKTEPISDALRAAGFRGAAEIEQNGRSVYTEAFGFADYANEVPNTAETRFATASAGKVFVAVGILQCIESGRLAFGDTLGSLLPIDWRAIDPAVTVEQLLTHTSGVPDYFDESTMDDYEELWRNLPNYRIRKNADLLPLFLDKPMTDPRGTKFQYNNTGYVVLAMILEALAGKPFDAVLREKVFDVCKMEATGYYELDRLPAKCANHYIADKDGGGFRTNIYSVDAKGTGAGGAFTTVGDIRRFWDALLSHRLLSPETTRAMLRFHAGDGKAEYYGLGIWLDSTDGGFSPFFQGCDPGVSFVSSYEPRENLTVTLASNYEDNVWKLRRSLLALLADGAAG